MFIQKEDLLGENQLQTQETDYQPDCSINKRLSFESLQRIKKVEGTENRRESAAEREAREKKKLTRGLRTRSVANLDFRPSQAGVKSNNKLGEASLLTQSGGSLSKSLAHFYVNL